MRDDFVSIGLDIDPNENTDALRAYVEDQGFDWYYAVSPVDVSREIAGVDMSKAQQSSDWGAEELTDAQLQYCANDVLHLHAIKQGLETMLKREGRMELAQACFDFLPVRADLDLEGWAETDIFAHS